MDGIKIKEELVNIKGRLENVEADLKSQILELNIKEVKWNKLDSLADQIKSYENSIVKFNISGKKFMTRISTLLSIRDTLFYKMIISRDVDFTKEVFFDRSPKYFGIILDFLRSKKINLKRFSKNELEDLREEAEYFEIGDLIEEMGTKPLEVEFVSYEFNGAYITSGITVGTNKIEDLSDPSMMKGICAQSPGWIIVELNSEWIINGIEIGGFKGNPSYWSPENGAYSSIYVSENKTNWTNVGTIPRGYGSSVKTVNFSDKVAKYIKFENTSYLGIGYLKVKTEKN